jgi:hypothetical protein
MYDYGVEVRGKSRYSVGISRDRISAISGKEDNLHPFEASHYHHVLRRKLRYGVGIELCKWLNVDERDDKSGDLSWLRPPPTGA